MAYTLKDGGCGGDHDICRERNCFATQSLKCHNAYKFVFPILIIN
jgi:hypothetical protein